MEGVVVEPGIAEVQLAPVAKGSINYGGNSPASDLGPASRRTRNLPFLDQIKSETPSRSTRPRNLPFLDQIKTKVTRSGIKSTAAQLH